MPCSSPSHRHLLPPRDLESADSPAKQLADGAVDEVVLMGAFKGC